MAHFEVRKLDMSDSTVSKLIYDGLQFVFPDNCFEELIINLDVFHPTCSKIVLSRALGVCITSASTILFVPQIVKIFNAKNAEGISVVSQLLAFLAAAGTTSYSFHKGFVFSQWGDSFFVSVQLLIIIMQILYYSSSYAYALAFFAFCWASVFAVIGDYISTEILTTVQTLVIPIMVVSKAIQVWRIYLDQSTGQLSLLSVSMQLAGTVARVFTSVQETGDNILIVAYALAAFLNAILFMQFFLYWDRSKQKTN